MLLRGHSFAIIFILLSCSYLLHAHELCLDLTEAKNYENSFCGEWSGHTCCTPEVDVQIRGTIEQLMRNVKPGYQSDCPDLMRRLLCARCDPWSAHLFETEASNGVLTKEVPVLCKDWCGKPQLYAACNSFEMDWDAANRTSIFGPDPLLKNNWPTLDAFCDHYDGPPSVSCFKGTVYEPNPPQPFPPDTLDICVEWVMHSTWEPILTDLEDPNDGTDRLFATWKNGTITMHKRSTGELLSTVIHIPETYNNAEAGLTVLAISHKFRDTGKIYVHYSCRREDCPIPCSDPKWCGTGTLGCSNGFCNSDHTSMVEEMVVRPDGTVDPASRRVLFRFAQPSPIHNAGSFWFGSDGFMYLALGDGGAFNDPYNRAQDMQTLLGKILRIDPDDYIPNDYLPYTIPADNPFVGVDGVWAEIWAYGLRNPWRCSVDSARPDVVMCGDVDTMEELNKIEKGGNYGWRLFEGTYRNPLFASEPVPENVIPPVINYTHEEMGGNCATIGGYFYRGTRNQCLVGQFVMADHMSVVWAADESRGFARRRLRWNCASDSDSRCDPEIGNIFTMAEDSNHDLYFSTSRGLYRIVENSRCGLPDDCSAATTGIAGMTDTTTSSGSASSTTVGSPTSTSSDNSEQTLTTSSSASTVVLSAALCTASLLLLLS